MSVATADVNPGLLVQSATVTVNLLALVGLAFCVPVVILAVASPVIVCAALVAWIVGRL